MTHGQTEELERAFQACSAAAARLFESHSPATLTHRPRPEAWSAAECVVHLSLTAAAFRPLLESALAGLRERRRAGPSRMDWKGRLLNWSLEPRPWLRMKTTARFQPVSTGPLDGVLPAFLQEQDGLVRALRSAAGLDLEAGRVTSPFNARLEYNVYTAFRILETHERRHLRQAEAAVSRADGPPPHLP